MRQLLILLCLIIVPFSTHAQDRAIDKEFLDAVEQRDVPRINAALAKGANVNFKEHINGHFALQYAIDWPDAGLVKLLLDKGANVNLQDDGGDTALIDAAGGSDPDHIKIVTLLLERGADVHVSNEAAIFAAARRGEPEVLRLLIDKGAVVNTRDSDRDKETVLMAAAGSASDKKLQMLIAAGADPKATNEIGQNALMKAVQVQHSVKPEQRIPMLELLLKSGADINSVDSNGNTPLLLSLVQFMSEAGGIISHASVVKFLLDHGADVQVSDKNGKTALIVTAAAWNSPIEVSQLLIERGVKIDARDKDGVSAFMIASEKDKLELVQLLLAKGANLNLKDEKENTALDYAVVEGRTEIAKLLLSKGGTSRAGYQTEKALLAATRNSALLRSSSANNLSEVRELLDSGADLKSRNSRGDTALMLAVENSYGKSDVAALLIQKGIDVDASNDRGDTALMIAVDRNDEDSVRLILDHRANVNAVNKKGRTTLHVGAAELRAKIVAAILAAGPKEVDSKDLEGKTPLLLAADNGSFVPDEVMELLLGKGANINATDNDGNTPLILAARSGSMSGVEYLLEKGASVGPQNKKGETALSLARKIHENGKITNAGLVESRIVKLLTDAGAH